MTAAVKVNVIAQAVKKALKEASDRLANPARVSDPDKLRRAVSGKTVLVTGASYGIGEATARKLAAAGATVLVVARSAERLDDLAASINAGGGRAVAYPTDLTDEAAVSVLTKQVTENHGPLDIVVSNAGKSLRRSCITSTTGRTISNAPSTSTTWGRSGCCSDCSRLCARTAVVTS